ncbi:GrpB family protein [Paenibacillus taiwanensis]|uniref:GrpB family protein n=1 Tax=Paenibacillus taiwanensis TaxID=401638 RepID=UPI000424ECA3|nr:GrpB family protein [Paenibacillus taiwanensis]
MSKNDDQTNWPVWATELIEIADPDPAWLEKGKQEEQQLYELLSPFGTREVKHIGSTSVPNLPAKPIIDIMADVDSFERITDVAALLSSYDWHYVPPHLDNKNWRRFFVKVKNDKRVAHLHFMLKGEQRWEKQLLFRDKLRGNPQLANEYANLKNNLAQKFNLDREAYTEAKTKFVDRVLRS